MIHNRAYTRAKTWFKAIRKRNIDLDIAAGRWTPRYNNLHQYANNAIHCSCPMCSAKTNNKNRRGARGWEPSRNWSMMDKRRLAEMEGQIKEYESEE